jgi:hypothetical protein
LLPFISFYFRESGLFNGLRPMETKKSARFPHLALKLWSANDVKPPQPLRAPLPARRVDSVDLNSMDIVSDFVKQRISPSGRHAPDYDPGVDPAIHELLHERTGVRFGDQRY